MHPRSPKGYVRPKHRNNPTESTPSPEKPKSSPASHPSNDDQSTPPKTAENDKKALRVDADSVQETSDDQKSAVSPKRNKAEIKSSSKQKNILNIPDLTNGPEIPDYMKRKMQRLRERVEKKKRREAKRKARANLLDGKVKSDTNRKRKREEKESETDTPAPSTSKHQKILSKFEKSTIKFKKTKEQVIQKEDEPKGVVAHGLEPLPQPAPAPENTEKPTYSSLPSWIANPIRAPADRRAKFSGLGISGDLVKILNNRGYKRAFAVQSTVIPLLLPTGIGHKGDLCISAATGSGKTLAYALPLVKAIEPTPVAVLRGVIVVPTRELVKQARGACELCATGSGLRIGTAVGNVAIRDEQRILMRTDSIYDPVAYEAQSERIMSDADWADFDLQNYMTDVEALDGPLYGYVNRPESNVDILICTPGRLVDHIRFTKGFTLRHVQWLVVDEADRLLNESFQDWVDVVMKSLDERKSPQMNGPAGEFLAKLSLPMDKKEPKKVILSATLTTDLAKLNTLRLRDPKLVIIGQDPGDPDENKETSYVLPETLKEFSIFVGSGEEKPLELLNLLLNHINVEGTSKITEDDVASTSSESSDDHNSDDSDDDKNMLDDTSSNSSDSASSGGFSDTPSVTGSEAPESERKTVLVFTKSSEAAARLARLLVLMQPSLESRIGTIIKSNKSSASRTTLRAYRAGAVSIIIATDRASRGLDLPGLTHVINYDMPTSVTTYVHRVGRTARAGMPGSAWTLVAHREGKWFSSEIAQGYDRGGNIIRDKRQLIKKTNIDIDMKVYQTMRCEYEAALEELAIEVMHQKRPKNAARHALKNSPKQMKTETKKKTKKT